MNVYVREYQKIEHRTRRRDSFALRYLPFLLLIAAAVVVGKIYVQSVALEWSRQVVAMQQEARDLELQNEDLVRSIAALTTRERVTRDAAGELGMIAPSGEEVVWLPVVEPSGGAAAATHARAADAKDRGVPAVVLGWVGGLWQEEALALTNR